MQRFLKTLQQQCLVSIRNTLIDCFIAMTSIFVFIGAVKHDSSKSSLLIALPFETIVCIACLFSIIQYSKRTISISRTANRAIRTQTGLEYCPEVYLFQKEYSYYENDKKFTMPVQILQLKSENPAHNSRLNIPKTYDNLIYHNLSSDNKYQIFILTDKYTLLIAI